VTLVISLQHGERSSPITLNGDTYIPTSNARFVRSSMDGVGVLS